MISTKLSMTHIDGHWTLDLFNFFKNVAHRYFSEIFMAKNNEKTDNSELFKLSLLLLKDIFIK